MSIQIIHTKTIQPIAFNKLSNMGPPPNYLITRKLVRHFFKKYLPTKPLNQIDPSAGLEDTIVIGNNINRLDLEWTIHKLD